MTSPSVTSVPVMTQSTQANAKRTANATTMPRSLLVCRSIMVICFRVACVLRARHARPCTIQYSPDWQATRQFPSSKQNIAHLSPADATDPTALGLFGYSIISWSPLEGAREAWPFALSRNGAPGKKPSANNVQLFTQRPVLPRAEPHHPRTRARTRFRLVAAEGPDSTRAWIAWFQQPLMPGRSKSDLRRPPFCQMT